MQCGAENHLLNSGFCPTLVCLKDCERLRRTLHPLRDGLVKHHIFHCLYLGSEVSEHSVLTVLCQVSLNRADNSSPVTVVDIYNNADMPPGWATKVW